MKITKKGTKNPFLLIKENNVQTAIKISDISRLKLYRKQITIMLINEYERNLYFNTEKTAEQTYYNLLDIITSISDGEKYNHD